MCLYKYTQVTFICVSLCVGFYKYTQVTCICVSLCGPFHVFGQHSQHVPAVPHPLISFSSCLQSPSTDSGVVSLSGCGQRLTRQAHRCLEHRYQAGHCLFFSSSFSFSFGGAGRGPASFSKFCISCLFGWIHF